MRNAGTSRFPHSAAQIVLTGIAVVALVVLCRRLGAQSELLTGTLLAVSIIGGMSSHDASDPAPDWQQALVDTIPALAWSARPDGARDFHSTRWLEFTGLSVAQAAGDGWADALHPDDRPQVLARWRAAVARCEMFEAEARGRSAGGDYRWFLIRAAPLCDAQGAVIRWYGINTDIEDRKRADAALREREEQWREVFEHNPVMYFMVDADATVLSVNGFGAAQLGYTVAELVGQSVLGVFFEEDRDFVRGNLDLCIDYPGHAHGWEVRKIRKNGTVLWVRENAKAVHRADKGLIVLIACEDITERKHADEQLHLARAELAHVTRVTTVGELTAAIAHEVNQPLTGLVTSGHAALRWLAADPPNLEAAQRAVERMINDGNRAGEVIGRIRAMVKKAPPRRDRLDVNEMLREVVSLIRGELQRNSIVLSTELARSLPPVTGDRVQLQQVILNLVLNAIEAMGGLHDRSRDLMVATAREPGGIVVTVRDSGPGLDEAELERLFEPFYTTKPEGMGMGLAISRTIIEAHGGQLGAMSNAPHGATFWFRLPADEDP